MISAGCASRCSAASTRAAARSRRGRGQPTSAAPICCSMPVGASAFCGCSPASSTSTAARSTAAARPWPRPTGRSARAAAERELRNALEPPRITLLRQFNALPEGVKFLVDRRAELIDLGRARPAAARSRRGSEAAARQLVRHRLSRTEADRLGVAGGPSRKADGLRGGARNPQLDRSEEPARSRPPLLCLFPPAHAGRAADLCRSGAGRGHGERHRCAARRSRTGRRSAGRRHRDLLLDLELPARPRRDQLRRLSDQARGRRLGQGPAAAQGVRDLVAGAGVSRLARSPGRGGGGGPAAAG